MDFLTRHIEALIFCATKPITLEEIQLCLNEMFDANIPVEEIQRHIFTLQTQYFKEEYSFSITQTGGGYQFLTKPAFQSSISILLKQQSKKRLSTSALETLSIIAYKQPIAKSQIELIRGVNCDYAVQKLLERGLIEIKGKSEGVGKPILYGTSTQFMDYFGINNIKDLPTLKDFTSENNEIGLPEELHTNEK